MTAVRQHEPGGPLVTETVPVPQPGRGEVLVRMASSPINFSDLAVLREGIPEMVYPATPGLEGSGSVVKAGRGILPALRSGKRIACTPVRGHGGTWAQYMCTNAMQTVPLPPDTSFQQGSMMLVNPMTALAFIRLAVKDSHAAMVNNASASALGKMLIRLASGHDLPLINVVRKEEHVTMLRGMGATHVLNSTNPSFEEDLKSVAAALNATLVFDAVTGEETMRLMRAVPSGSTLVAYARLSGEPLQADPADLIKYGKQITGFQLGHWLSGQTILTKLRLIRQVRKQLSGPLTSEVQATFPLQRVKDAITHYRENMSAGKVLLNLE